MKPAPIAIFAFRRPDHLERCLGSLAANEGAEKHDLIIFCDGARNPNDVAGVSKTREIAREAKGFASVQVVERSENFGLAKSIITGVSKILVEREAVIVIEDDLVFAPWFLRFMRDGLEAYAEHDSVASIVGYCYPLDAELPETYFLRGTDCFGWATWKRAWSKFSSDGQRLAAELASRGMEREFDVDGSYPFTRLLRQQNRGEVSSWAVRWHASTFLADMVSLFPGRSLVLHRGDDALATHASDASWLNGPLSDRPISVELQEPQEDRDARDALARFFRTKKAGFGARALGWMRRRLNRLKLAA